MGYFKERYGYPNSTNDSGHDHDKCICSQHIEDEAIAAFIEKYSDEGTCDYCGEDTKVALLKDVIDFIKEGVFSFYGDANNEGMAWESEEDGYYGAPKFDTEEMLFYEVGLDVEHDQLRKDLILAFGYDEWCDKDPYADRENEELDYNWIQFKQVIKHKARYVFLGSKQFNNGVQETPVDEILNDIGRRVDNLNLFTQFDPGTLLYRCRQHRDGEVLDKAKQLTAPPYERAIYPNRMSPAGISMFYCAFDVATCHAETISLDQPDKQFVTTVAFTNKERLFLLDLTKLPPLPSIFDPVMRSNYYSIKFLRKFVEDLSKPIDKNGIEHIEYVPTQVVTEYFRYTYEDLTGSSLDGIVYPSSKLRGKNACVLFYDHKQSLEKLDFVAKSLSTSKVF